MPPQEVRREVIVVETHRYRVEGQITLPQEGYRSRLSDYLNRQDQDFLIIENAQLNALDGSGRDWSAPVILLARRNIQLVVPAGNND